MIILIFIVTWAIIGVAKQGGRDVKRGASKARTATRTGSSRAVRKGRTHPSRKVRYPAHAAHYGARTGAGAWRGVRAFGRGVAAESASLWQGAKAGARTGRERHAAYAQKRTERKAARRAAWDPEPFPRTKPRTDDRTDPEVKPHVRDAAESARTDSSADNVRTDSSNGDGPQQDSGREQIATVTPIREDNVMTAPTGEVTGLAAAIHLYNEWIDRLGDGPAELETLSAGMSSHGVSGDAVQAPAQAAEHLDAARAAMETGKQALEQHMAAAEHLIALHGDEAESTAFYTTA